MTAGKPQPHSASKGLPARTGQQPLLQVEGLRKYFTLGRRRILHAVDDVTFSVCRGEVFGLVGESGCGKTTVGRTLLGLYTPTAGRIIYDGQDVTHARGQLRREFQRRAQMIFQDPYASLDPRMTVADIVGEALDIHHLARGAARQQRIQELLELVGLSKEHASRFPHEFSGGQRQRIGIARALAVNPEFLVADEPISALDVSIQAQVVNLLAELKEQKNLTYIFIAHDLAMVRHLSDRVGVMYLGQLVELADTDELYREPLHPYTQGLLSAVPIPDPRAEKSRQRQILQGEVPSPINPGPGCRFRARCPLAKPICAEVSPPLREARPGHQVACHLYD
ncbi:MAG: ABC transporter ATP-binding protein [Limnochordaceae bacterium]|nr:ABC transporter ATP-binding protein [Limnochordaceae bacterium]